MDKTLYPQYADNWDDEAFRSILLERINHETACLDYGAGRGHVAQMNFRGLAKTVAGVDPTEEVLSNPFLDKAQVLDLSKSVIPYADNSFDVVFSDNVLEHVQEPLPTLWEISRVLRPGGVFLAKTPNKHHYIQFIARLTPHWFHRFYNRLRGRREHDTFPTVYRINTGAAVRRYAAQAGLLVKRITFFEGRPEYLRLTALTYIFGYLYERLVNRFSCLAPFRCIMIFELEKTNDGHRLTMAKENHGQ